MESLSEQFLAFAATVAAGLTAGFFIIITVSSGGLSNLENGQLSWGT